MKKLFTRFGIFALVIILMFNVCAGAFAASTSDEVTAREQESSDFSCYAATQGMVLLENSGVLPIAKEAKVALFGGGVRHTVKGGTGSGAVNQRSTVNVEEGFEAAGYTVTTKDYLDAFDAKAGNGGGGGGMWGSRLTDDVEDIDAFLASSRQAMAVSSAPASALSMYLRHSRTAPPSIHDKLPAFSTEAAAKNCAASSKRRTSVCTLLFP